MVLDWNWDSRVISFNAFAGDRTLDHEMSQHRFSLDYSKTLHLARQRSAGSLILDCGEVVYRIDNSKEAYCV